MDSELENILNLYELEENKNIEYIDYIKRRQLILYDNSYIIAQYIIVSLNIYIMVVYYHFVLLNHPIILKK
jgi:hypothetical protein